MATQDTTIVTIQPNPVLPPFAIVVHVNTHISQCKSNRSHLTLQKKMLFVKLH